MSNHHTFILTGHQVELFKLLKLVNLVGSGGEAKMVIAEGMVYLNNAVETQKRKKIVAGDTVEFNGEVIEIKAGENG